jgi:demethylmenaquinone methyltransferase/2-methoxy-6-polyprenyl-1,4-benzoquinol methylase
MRDNTLDTAMRQYYARRAPEYDDWYERLGRYDDPETNAQWHAEVAELGRVAATFGGGELLDIACGTGRWTRMFAANPRVTSVTALDRSPEMLAQTRARLHAAGLTATLVEGDAYALPFPDAAFDACFFGFLLSHVPTEAVGRFLGEVRRVLRPTGALLIFDSQLPPGRPAIEVQQRPLKDGSTHAVLKVYYTSDTLTDALAPIFGADGTSARSTGQFFVIGQHQPDRQQPSICE